MIMGGGQLQGKALIVVVLLEEKETIWQGGVEEGVTLRISEE